MLPFIDLWAILRWRTLSSCTFSFRRPKKALLGFCAFQASRSASFESPFFIRLTSGSMLSWQSLLYSSIGLWVMLRWQTLSSCPFSFIRTKSALLGLALSNVRSFYWFGALTPSRFASFESPMPAGDGGREGDSGLWPCWDFTSK